jgi:hypothetical protein
VEDPERHRAPLAAKEIEVICRRIRVSKLISLDFGYRIWAFDYESDDDLKKLDLALAGFGGGLTFHF